MALPATQETALSQAGEQTPGALSTVDPNLVTQTVTAPGSTTQSTATPTAPVVKVGSLDIPVSEIPALIERFQAESEELEELAQVGRVLKTFEAQYGLDATGMLLNEVEQRITTGKPAEAAKPIFDVKVPDDFTPVTHDKMSDEALTVLLTGQKLLTEMHSRMQSLSNIVAGMQRHFQAMHTESTDVKTAQALKLHGIVTDAAGVKRMREEHGIAEPLKAIPFLKTALGISVANGSQPATAPPVAAGVGQAPPEAPVSGGTNVFDPTGMDTDEVFRRKLRGEVASTELKTA